jgi:CRISPR-associated protein Csb3
MAEASIPVNPFNPGQVFACLGFLEAAEVLLGDAHGRFDWTNDARPHFELRARGDTNPVGEVLAFLQGANVKWLSPHAKLRERDGGETEVVPGISASADPKSPDLPGVLRSQHNGLQCELPFGFWADGSGRFATTFKKSTNGVSSHVRLKNGLDAIRQMDLKRAALDPLNQEARTESLFRLDPRGVVDPIHGGFSPDSLRKGAKGGLDVRVATYPLCEVLAILGLEHARPERIDSEHCAYCVWDHWLPTALARAAIGGNLGFGRVRRFIVEHVEVKRGGDRKMNHITEEMTL